MFCKECLKNLCKCAWVQICGKLTVFGSGGGSRWDWFCGGKKVGELCGSFLHSISQGFKVFLSLHHHLCLSPKRVCSIHLVFAFLYIALSQCLQCILARAAGMTALKSSLDIIIHNHYTERSKHYLNNKKYDVTTFVKDRATGKLQVKSQIPYNQLACFLTKLSTQNVQTSTSILSED